jgi:tRNA/tmRNA/rRNA uracil-C5-methylase (TrmA/RlmC/RlmD family)
MNTSGTTFDGFQIGDHITVDVGNVAHGGHFIAHHLGKTIFVRGVLDGERAIVEVTSFRKKIYEARVVEILHASPMRVTPPCQSSASCGGCDFQHVSMKYQRTLKTKVLMDSLRKFAGLSQSEVERLVGNGVMSLPHSNTDGTDWRTRARFVWDNGWHMHEYRSHRLTPTPECLVVTPAIRASLNALSPATRGEEFVVAEGSEGVSISGAGRETVGPTKVQHLEFGVTWRLKPTSFWQAHSGIIPAMAEFIDSNTEYTPDQRWWDLYSGAGVFAAYLSKKIDQSGKIYAVESSTLATQAAKRALHDKPQIRVIQSDVSEFIGYSLKSADFEPPTGIILDPPRLGAGREVCEKLLAVGAPIIIYIACDPVAMSRDLAYLSQSYSILNLAAWDAFPMSHHFESVAILTKDLS